MTSGTTLEELQRQERQLLQRTREEEGGGTVTGQAWRLRVEAAKMRDAIDRIERARSWR